MPKCSESLIELEKVLSFVGGKFPELSGDCVIIQRKLDPIIREVLRKEKPK